MLRSKCSVTVEAPRSVSLFSRFPVRKAFRSLESDLESSSWFPQALRPWWQRLRFALLADLGEKAVLGRDGWLFYAPDVRYLVEPLPPATSHAKNDDPFSAIIAFRDQLSRKGIRLLVVPMPVKPSVYPDKLTRRVAPGGQSFSSHTLELISSSEQRVWKSQICLRRLGDCEKRIPCPKASPTILFETRIGLARRSPSPQKRWPNKSVVWGGSDSGSTDYDLKAVMVKRRSDVAQMVKAPGIEEKVPSGGCALLSGRSKE